MSLAEAESVVSTPLRLILSRHALENHRTGSDANTNEKLSGKSHRLPNSIVYGTASRVKPSPR